jgi:hypothetical protein
MRASEIPVLLRNTLGVTMMRTRDGRVVDIAVVEHEEPAPEDDEGPEEPEDGEGTGDGAEAGEAGSGAAGGPAASAADAKDRRSESDPVESDGI